MEEKDSLSLAIEYWDSEGNRHINFNLPEERKKYEKWLNKKYPPKQLSMFDEME